jgi:small GTP-binding protein
MFDQRTASTKVVLCGPASVGKTAIFQRIIDQADNQARSSTIGASFALTVGNAGGRELSISLWDTAGQEQYRSLVNIYFRAAGVGVIVFDLTSIASYETIGTWHSDLMVNCGTHPDVILVGNKCDLREERAVSEQDIVRIANELNLRYFEVSALQNINIDDLFRYVSTVALDRMTMRLTATTSPPINLEPQEAPGWKIQAPCCRSR